LSSEDETSYVEYKINIYNSYDETYYFQYVDYVSGGNTYSNENIIYSLEGLNKYDPIEPGQTIEFTLKFSYKDGVIPDDTHLESYLIFVFMKRYTATNMIENGSFENAFTIDTLTQDATTASHGSYSANMNYSDYPNLTNYLGYYNFYKDHVYYFSGDFNVTYLSGDNSPYVYFEAYIWLDDSWGGSQWALQKFHFTGETNGWVKETFISKETQDGINIPIRLGIYDSDQEIVYLSETNTYFDAFTLIDLTETFGAGNEPDEEWCDQNI
jgi:hypothetical protein